MVSFTTAAAIALLASISSVAAAPFASNEVSTLVARQATLPTECTDYCSVSAGCVCIIRPTNCAENYTVDAGETCGTVVDRFPNITATALYEWNPELGQTCFGLTAYVPVCVSVPGYVFPGAVKAGDIFTPDQTPVPVQPSIVSNCTKYEYTDRTGLPILATVLSSNGITKQQWNSWNFPTQDPEEDWASWAGYFSCVAA
ncbi:carbohydrate-binding module family 50 protein [Pleomassaria siparia CBS 279.74]|uniref:Carbohydrate-binding module family 50 protein n=1 Tax=Pleomassaria siparia CBS 279.74 TaxID=1314801 RepID=A0A6G1K6L2_9PLEO|nr:carbohydrate-binding module family 50 protein [Pleomassaria siparia CBS 279.74]